jgi:hypothetical protein
MDVCAKSLLANRSPAWRRIVSRKNGIEGRPRDLFRGRAGMLAVREGMILGKWTCASKIATMSLLRFS